MKFIKQDFEFYFASTKQGCFFKKIFFFNKKKFFSGKKNKRDFQSLLNGQMVSIVSPAEMLSKNDAENNLQERQNGTVTEIFSKISALVGNALRKRIKS